MVIAGKLLLGLISALAILPLLAWANSPRVANRQFDRIACLIFILTRGGIFFGLLIALHMPATSDVTIYYEEAKSALAGKMPLRDIQTAYGPLFPYVAGAAVYLWDSAKALVVLAVLFEFASLPLWLKVGRKVADEQITRIATIVYLLFPVSYLVVALNGQNHVWISFFLAASLLLELNNRSLASGLVLGLSIVVVKFFSLLFVPVFLLMASRSNSDHNQWNWKKMLRWSLGLALIPLLCYGYLLSHGVNIFAQVRFHAFYNSSGNFPYYLSAFGLDLDQHSSRTIANIAGMLVLLTLVLAPFRAVRRDPFRAVAMCGFLVIAVLFVSKKAFTSYLVHALFPICLALAAMQLRRGSILLFMIFGILVAVEPTLWFRWMHQSDLSRIFSPGPNRILRIAFLLCETVLLAGYAILACSLWKRISRRAAPASKPT